MSNQDGHRADSRRASRLNEHRATDAVDWGVLRALNERCIELMVALARSEQPNAPPAVSLNRELWCGLDPAARERASDYQLLLLDINFTDPTWWRGTVENRPVERPTSIEGYLQPEVASQLMRATITLAWIIARKDQGQATFFCGMAPPVARLFASFSPADLDHLCAKHHRHLRLRFDDHPSYWRMHLKSSVASWSRAPLSPR